MPRGVGLPGRTGTQTAVQPLGWRALILQYRAQSSTNDQPEGVVGHVLPATLPRPTFPATWPQGGFSSLQRQVVAMTMWRRLGAALVGLLLASPSVAQPPAVGNHHTAPVPSTTSWPTQQGVYVVPDFYFRGASAYRAFACTTPPWASHGATPQAGSSTPSWCFMARAIPALSSSDLSSPMSFIVPAACSTSGVGTSFCPTGSATDCRPSRVTGFTPAFPITATPTWWRRSISLSPKACTSNTCGC